MHKGCKPIFLLPLRLCVKVIIKVHLSRYSPGVLGLCGAKHIPTLKIYSTLRILIL